MALVIDLRLQMSQHVAQFLAGSIHYPIGNELGQISSIGVAAAPYHIVPEVTNAAKNTAAILLDKTVSMLPIRNAR